MKHERQVVTQPANHESTWEVGAEPTNNAVAAQIRLLRRKLSEVDGLIETIWNRLSIQRFASK